MENCNCPKENSIGRIILEVIISIIIGVIVGVLFSTGVITTLTNFVIIALVTSAISLLILISSLYIANIVDWCNIKRCVGGISISLLVSSIGGIIAGVIGLTISIATATVASILVIAFTAFFFVWNLLSIISLVLCLAKETHK